MERRKEGSYFTRIRNKKNYTPATARSESDESGSESPQDSTYNDDDDDDDDREDHDDLDDHDDDHDDDDDDDSNESGCHSFLQSLFPSSNQTSSDKHQKTISVQETLESADKSVFLLTQKLDIAIAKNKDLRTILSEKEHRHKQQIDDLLAKELVTGGELANAKKTNSSLMQTNAKYLSELLEMKEVERVVANTALAERTAIMEILHETESKAKVDLTERLYKESKRLTELEEVTSITQIMSKEAVIAATTEKCCLEAVVTTLQNRNKELLEEIKITVDAASNEKNDMVLTLRKTTQKLNDEISVLANENARYLAKIREKKGTEDELFSTKNIVIKLNDEIHHLKAELASTSMEASTSNAKHQMQVDLLDKQKKKVADDLFSFTTQLINSLDK